MASSKTTGRKPAAKKSAPRRTLPSKTATKARLTEAENRLPSGALAQATKDTPLMDLSPAEVTPPQALAAGQEPSPVVVTAGEPSKEPALNKRELIDAAVLRSGVKKKDAKPVVEALLAILGETVASGRDLNLKPFGKLHLNRSEERSNGTVHVCRLRQPLPHGNGAQKSAEEVEVSCPEPLAQAGS